MTPSPTIASDSATCPPALPALLNDAEIITNDPPPPYSSHTRTRSSTQGRNRHAHRLSRNAIIQHAYPVEPPLLPDGIHIDPAALHGAVIHGQHRRQRTLSTTSTLASTAPSFTHTIASMLFSDDDDEQCIEDTDSSDNHTHSSTRVSRDAVTGRYDPEELRPLLDSHAHPNTVTNTTNVRSRPTWAKRVKRYFRPMRRKVYWKALCHLLVINFPFALAAWVYLFVFTVLGTTLLILLPLGALLSFLNLMGARVFARGELYLQMKFHADLGYPTTRLSSSFPILPRPPNPNPNSNPTPSQLESSVPSTQAQDDSTHAQDLTQTPTHVSFYTLLYTLLTSPSSYHSLFYFLVIKPAITLPLSILLLVLGAVVGVGSVGLGMPIVLRVARRVGRWQAGVGVDGLLFVGR